MDLRPELDPASTEPLYRQLSSYLEGLIDGGALAPGDRLPATRELALQLGVNRTTISAAYEWLEAEGRLSGQVGRGSFVRAKPRASELDWDRLLVRRRPMASAPYTGGAAAISFAASRPPDELFPLDDFQRSCDEVLSQDGLRNILQLGAPGGYEPLRRYLLEECRLEGALGSGDDLMITNGCQQAMDLLRRVLVAPGTRVAIEDPVYPGLKNVLLEGDADIVGLPVGRQGIDPEAWRNSGARIAMVTPNFQNPTGSSLTLEDRVSLLRIARDQAGVLIENDMYSPLRYEGEAVPSLKQLAPEAGTVLLRSFSKIAFPGLRLGWVAGPRPLIAAMRDAKQYTDLHSDQFSQAVVLRFMESGRLARHQERMIEAGRERLRVTLESAARCFPAGSRWTQPRGGLNVWVTLPEGWDAAHLLVRGQREGVGYLPGAVFAVERPAHNALRLSFGSVRPQKIREGLEILGRIFEAERDSRRHAEAESVPALV